MQYQKLILEVLKCLVACRIEMSTFTGNKFLTAKKMEINLSTKLYLWRKMDIRGSTCYLCGALSPRELPDFCNQDFFTCDTALKIPLSVCVCVCACERERERVCVCERERELVGILYCGVYLNCTIHRSSYMNVIFRFEVLNFYVGTSLVVHCCAIFK